MTQKNLQILRVSHLRGPNIWTYRPVIEAWLDLGELEDRPSNAIPGFYERLTALLPGLAQHRCGVGEVGGFLERLRDGTWAGHILEHICLELQNLAGMPTGFGKTRMTSVHGIYKMAFRTRQEEVGRAALQAGHDLLLAAIEDRPYDVAATVTRLRELCDRLCLGPSTAHIVEAATDRRIPHIRLNDGNLVQLGYGAQQHRIWTAETDQTSAIAESIASDKQLTKELLQSCGVPVPEGEEVDSPEKAWDVAQDIGVPVTVKPTDANHGRGVFTDLHTREDVEKAWHAADTEGSGVLVEKFIEGEAHRLLVVGKQVVAATRGKKQTVTGDGRSTVLQLIDSQINSDPRCGEAEEFPLEPLILDKEPIAQLELARQGYSGSSVPAAGQLVLIRRHGDLAYDVTDQVHPKVAAAAALAARVVGLDIAGIDLVTPDISRPLAEQGGAIIEVNAGPGLLMHLKPAEGQPRNVGQAIVAHLFPGEGQGRIPIVGITGSRNTTRVARLVNWLLHINGTQVGLACRDGFFLGPRQVETRDGSDWASGQRLLINRSLEAAVFEHSHRAILSEGLAYDRCTVGVVTDLDGQEELAEFYIDDAEKLYNVVRTQVDVILPTGTAVLNAADPRVVGMAALCDGQVIFYGPDAQLPAIAQHRQQGERTVFLRERHIVLAQGLDEISEIPLDTLSPNKAAKPDMVMAAVAAAWALDVKPELIGAGLRTFKANLTSDH
ncbi:cyanophycin synthetase [Rhodoferax sp. BAB1]|uniref:cyanophycin synthetase n=1 Tax=Rhodoferax sp. BAB1 TaxID=2741720 RepID=UPI001575FAA7|nr:cyanophycin synthetase [Rhodoferax sp. BAB1]QKO20724.1 cyanophycin synthetase [Rhodoferax sp. BAB1]